MAKKMYTGNINVSKITKEKLYTGKNGDKWCNVVVFVDDENPDKFGNTMAIVENRGKDERDNKPNYLGNMKQQVKQQGNVNQVKDTGSDISTEDLPW